jgi:hypothetical protein
LALFARLMRKPGALRKWRAIQILGFADAAVGYPARLQHYADGDRQFVNSLGRVPGTASPP